MRYAPLLAALQQRQILAAPMTADELTDAIEKPASAAGYVLEPGLTGLLLRDLRSGDPALAGESALPLLSYALLSTWQRREGRELTMAGYQAAGGIWDAVAQAAERVYGRLPATGQAAVRAILLAMVRFGDGTEDTRRSADLDELMNAKFRGDTSAFRQARDELAAARLITLGSGGATMTHEALLRAWPRLRGWIDADRASLLLQQRFADAAATWQRTGRDPAALYRGTLLADALRWAAQQGGLSPLEQEFLHASAEEQWAGEQTARRRLRRTQAAIAALAALLSVSLTLTVVAVQAHANAVASARRAQSQSFANQALVLRDTDPQRAALMALAGWQTQHSTTARGSLLSLAVDAYRGTLAAGFVYADAISPDGRYVATAATVPAPGIRPDPTVRLWDARTHRRLAILRTGFTLSVTFSPDGRTLAAAVLSKRTVQLWNVATRRLIRVVNGLGASAVAFTPDGRLLAVAEGDRAVHLLNPATGAQLAVVPDGLRLVRSLAFSPNGRLLAAGGVIGGAATSQHHGLTRVWDMRTRTLIATLPATGADIVSSIAFSPDGRLLASAPDNSEIMLWDTVTGRPLPPLAAQGQVGSVAFSPDGLAIVAGGGDRTVRFWLTSSRSLYASYAGYPGGIYALAFSRDGHTLVVGGDAGATLLNYGGDVLPAPDGVTSVAFSRNGRMVATAGLDGAVRIWNAATGWPTRAISSNPGGVESVTFSPDGRLLASGGGDHHVRLWDPATGAPLGVLRTVGPVATGVAFSPDGSLLAAASYPLNPKNASQVRSPGAVQVWDSHSRKLLATIDYRSGALAGPAFSPGGSLLAYATTGAGDQVVLADARTLRTVAVLKTRSQIYGLAFSPDGRMLAASGANSTVTLWDTRIHRRIRSISAGSSQARDVAFSPNGRTLAVGSANFLVQIFDVRTHTLTAVLNGHTDVVNGVAFSPGGQTLASASGDGTALLWNLDPRAAVRRLCQTVQGPSLAKQWAALPGNPGPLPCPG
jgi:WD40 repeat protein